MTTIRLFGGSFGSEEMMAACDLDNASAPVMVNYCESEDEEWVHTQYQCADARHTVAGLVKIGKELAARALEIPDSDFACDWAEVVDE